jgi:RAB protein geranylgeranyltransferase component A
LHLDRNDYYGGNEAALSLSEAEEWAKRHAGSEARTGDATISHATVDSPTNADGEGVKLSQPRAYSLALAPHIIHAQSTLLAALVSSRLHNQLDFQAVGSWFILEKAAEALDANVKISRVPSSREDIFRDSSFDLRAKRSLVKFLRFVQTYEEQSEVWNSDAETPFTDFLQRKFGLPPSSHAALLALTLGSGPSAQVSTATALPKISRHLRSIGVFGPGFGAVLPKWGGLAEIAQVACRAGAVGGGVYVLKKGIKSCSPIAGGSTELVLSEGEKISTSWLVGCPDDIPAKSPPAVTDGLTKGIFIVAPALCTLFPPTSEGGVTPAGAVVAIPSGDPEGPPVHIIAHSHESGECPSSQSKFHHSFTNTNHMMILRKTYLHCLIYIDYKLSTFLTRSFFPKYSIATRCIGR